MSRRNRRGQAGQALTEYILLILVIVGVFSYFMSYLPNFMEQLESPITGDFRKTYRYGHPQACGRPADDSECPDGPKNHPRIYQEDNFRVFARGSE